MDCEVPHERYLLQVFGSKCGVQPFVILLALAACNGSCCNRLRSRNASLPQSVKTPWQFGFHCKPGWKLVWKSWKRSLLQQTALAQSMALLKMKALSPNWIDKSISVRKTDIPMFGLHVSVLSCHCKTAKSNVDATSMAYTCLICLFQMS